MSRKTRLNVTHCELFFFVLQLTNEIRTSRAHTRSLSLLGPLVFYFKTILVEQWNRHVKADDLVLREC